MYLCVRGKGIRFTVTLINQAEQMVIKCVLQSINVCDGLSPQWECSSVSRAITHYLIVYLWYFMILLICYNNVTPLHAVI